MNFAGTQTFSPQLARKTSNFARAKEKGKRVKQRERHMWGHGDGTRME